MELNAQVHEEDGMYWAQVDELPGCFASGATIAEVVEALEEAVSLYLAPSASSPRRPTHVARLGLHVDDSLVAA